MSSALLPPTFVLRIKATARVSLSFLFPLSSPFSPFSFLPLPSSLFLFSRSSSFISVRFAVFFSGVRPSFFSFLSTVRMNLWC